MAPNIIVKSINHIKELRKKEFGYIIRVVTVNNSEVDFEPFTEIRQKQVSKKFGNIF